MSTYTKPFRVVIFAVMALAPFTSSAASGATAEQFSIDAPRPALFELFGGTVSVDGDTLAVGTRSSDPSQSGVVYVYKHTRDSWKLQTELSAQDATAGDMFGSCLALRGNTLAIGANGSHAIYIFVRDGVRWVQQIKLTAPDFGRGLGSSVALDDDTLAAGGGGISINGAQGSIYIFRNLEGTWVKTALIIPQESSVSQFGSSLALKRDTLLVGAPLTAESNTFGAGAAFTYTEKDGTWTEQARFHSDNPSIGGAFGISVDLDDDHHAAIGERDPGAVYVFVQTDAEWKRQAKLTSQTAGDESEFGTSVAFGGHHRLMVGAFENDQAIGTAFIYRLTHNHWTQERELIPHSRVVCQYFGMAVAASGKTFLGGAPFFNAGDLARVGRAYVFTLP